MLDDEGWERGVPPSAWSLPPRSFFMKSDRMINVVVAQRGQWHNAPSRPTKPVLPKGVAVFARPAAPRTPLDPLRAGDAAHSPSTRVRGFADATGRVGVISSKANILATQDRCNIMALLLPVVQGCVRWNRKTPLWRLWCVHYIYSKVFGPIRSGLPAVVVDRIATNAKARAHGLRGPRATFSARCSTRTLDLSRS